MMFAFINIESMCVCWLNGTRRKINANTANGPTSLPKYVIKRGLIWQDTANRIHIWNRIETFENLLRYSNWTHRYI